MKVLAGGLHCHPIKCWTDGVELEEAAQKQLHNVSSLPFIYKHIAVMPDVHWGMGATVGSVIPTKGAIVPAAVGVDIGCGMIAQRLNVNASRLPDNLHQVRLTIESAVPCGRSSDNPMSDEGSWRGLYPDDVASVWSTELQNWHAAIVEKHPGLKRANTINHLGTLGTGNHFIEVCLDETNQVWVVLHSGSRGIGNRIGSYFIELAAQDMAKYFITLPDRDLAFLPEHTEAFHDYIWALNWAQRFAFENRALMMKHTLAAIARELKTDVYDLTVPMDLGKPMIINCHHNYTAKEQHFGEVVWVTRKGAVSAKAGELGVIPGSMGAKSYIVRGKGNPESFESCSHGAGRRMSRGEAKRTFSVLQHCAATAGVECKKDASVIDETPGAYKDIDAVMAAQADLVDVVHTLKQVVCVKG
jgi:tRNA-splicing ligase RtcB (3'-phosphate/5'-hydroxy nucleic acid ligase)